MGAASGQNMKLEEEILKQVNR